MTAIVEESSMNYQTALRQSKSKQDFVDIVCLNNGIAWMIIMDGHGYHTEKLDDTDLVTWLHKFDWATFLDTIKEDNPINKLETIINKQYKSTVGIGAAISLVRIKNGLEASVWWRGDSYVNIFEEGQLIAQTEIISIDTEKEQKRLKKQGIEYTLEDSFRPKVLSTTDITMEPSHYICFKGQPDKINMSQCLGHDNASGFSDNRIDVVFNNRKNYKIVGGSDGLWDVFSDTPEDNTILTSYSAKELVDVAYNRWMQEWNYVWYGESYGHQTLEGRDDICCAVYNINN